MNRYYSTVQLSSRISETPEGYLICEGVPIARAGDMIYADGETPVSAGKDGIVVISRKIDDIHDPATIASFEGKPVTIKHPDDFVTPDNWRDLAVGVTQNVRPGEGDDADKLLADLLITDAEAISAVKSKRLREVSCGYEADYTEESPGRGRQHNIRGNHVALVAAGRCGSECAIFDHAPKEQRMSMRDKIMGIFGKALDEAMPEAAEQPETTDQPDIAEVLASIVMRIEAIEAAMKPTDEEPEGEKPEGDEEQADHTPEEMTGLEERFATIEKALAKLAGVEMGDEDQGEVSLDAETIARAEILSPGISKTGDVKAKSLTAAYGTEDGKAAIDTLLAGKAFDAADKDMLFTAAAEMLKVARRGQLHASRVSLDSLPSMKSGDMTPEKINAMNAARYGKH